MINKIKEKYTKRKKEKTQNEIEIISKYLNRIEEVLISHNDKLYKDNTSKFTVDLQLPDTDYLLSELKSEDVEVIKYNGMYLIKNSLTQNTTAVALLEKTVEEQSVLNFLLEIETTIGNINVHNRELLDLDVNINGIQYKVLFINDSSGGKSIPNFLIKKGFDFRKKHRFSDSNIHILEQKQNELDKILSNESVSILTPKIYSTLFIERYINEGNIFFSSSGECTSILNVFGDKDIFEYRKNITTDINALLNILKYNTFNRYIFFYPSIEEIKYIENNRNNFSKITIITDHKTSFDTIKVVNNNVVFGEYELLIEEIL